MLSDPWLIQIFEICWVSQGTLRVGLCVSHTSTRCGDSLPRTRHIALNLWCDVHVLIGLIMAFSSTPALALLVTSSQPLSLTSALTKTQKTEQKHCSIVIPHNWWGALLSIDYSMCDDEWYCFLMLKTTWLNDLAWY